MYEVVPTSQQNLQLYLPIDNYEMMPISPIEENKLQGGGKMSVKNENLFSMM